MPHTDIHASDLPAAFDELERENALLKQRIREIDDSFSDSDLEDDEPISPQNDDGSYFVAQIPLFCAIINHITKRHGNVMMEARRDNVVIEASNMIVDAYRQPITRATPGMGIEKWLASDDTGMSSLAMARRLCQEVGGHQPRIPLKRYSDGCEHPSDPSDFGRCIRLLEAVPQLREHLPSMAGLSPVWAAYVARWDEMEKLYRDEFPTGSAPKLYALMQSIRDQVAKEQPCETASDSPASAT